MAIELDAIEIIFYDENDEPMITHRRSRVPAYLLDMAIDLAPQMEKLSDEADTRPADERTAPLFDFIVEFFGRKFTREELKQHADLIDCMSVFRSVMARANGLMLQMTKENPTPARYPKRK